MANNDAQFVFRVFSANRSDEMEKLMRGLKEIVEQHCDGSVHTEIIDVLNDPERAIKDKVFGTPTLIKDAPEPSLRVLGDLSDPRRILVLFGLLEVRPEPKPE
jgi:circadian clock protein KaiB